MFPRTLLITFALDYALTAICAILGFTLEFLHPFEKIIFLNDPDIQFPIAQNESVPVWVVPVLYILRSILDCLLFDSFDINDCD